MCTGLEPLILSAAGTAISVFGQIQQAEAQAEMYGEQARQTARQAGYEQDAAAAQAEKIRKAGRKQQGEAKAALAASGVKLGEGTALEIDKEIEANVEEDALSALLTGRRIGKTADEEASMLSKAGRNAATAGYMGAGATVLGGAGTIASGWAAYTKGAKRGGV